MFLVAFPGEPSTRRAALTQLAVIARRWRGVAGARAAAEKTGIAGTTARPQVAWPIARLLARGEDAEIDWPGLDDPAAFDALVERLVAPSEQDAFGGGEYTTRRWIELARPREATALQWLTRGGASLARRGFAAAWDAAEVPLRWTAPRLEAIDHACPAEGAADVAPRISPADRADAGTRSCGRWKRSACWSAAMPRASLIWRAVALVARSREVHAMSYANPAEVHLADLGEGVELAVIGVLPEQRLQLEANYGTCCSATVFRSATAAFRRCTGRRTPASTSSIRSAAARRRSSGCRRCAPSGRCSERAASSSTAISSAPATAKRSRSGAYWFYWRWGSAPACRRTLHWPKPRPHA